MSDERTYRVSADALREFCSTLFQALDVPAEDADITADVLVEADLRGVASHGVARLRRYVNGLRGGVMLPRPDVRVLQETPATAAIDAGAGLGQPVSYRAMLTAIEKARHVGVGVVSVRNSNHYGIAGYYAMMALEEDMIGMSMTNTDALAVPTFGRDALLGTNPIAVAMPAGDELPYVLDMATSIVPRGKLEVYQRLEKPIPMGWATDEFGITTDDPGRVLRNLANRNGGGLLPLGGEGELMGGHKGYGLALLVELLSGVLSGAAYLDLTYPTDEQGLPLPSNIGHIFAAMRVDAFMPTNEFKVRMDDAIRRLRDSRKAVGQDRIWIHGEKEFENTEENLSAGVPLHGKVYAELQAIAEELEAPSFVEDAVGYPLS